MDYTATPYPYFKGHIIKALPGDLGNKGKGAFISGEQMPNFEGNRGTKAILGDREHKKTNFSIFGEQGDKPIYFKGTRYPPGRASLSYAWY